jgi:hypothetical protein
LYLTRIAAHLTGCPPGCHVVTAIELGFCFPQGWQGFEKKLLHGIRKNPITCFSHYHKHPKLPSSGRAWGCSN